MRLEQLTDRLRKLGYRLTPQRLVVLQVLEDTPRHLNAAEIYQQASKRLPGVNEATIYRTLDFLVGHGLALAAHIGSGRIVYESTAHEHHHLICRRCGQTTEIDHSELAPLFEHFEQTTGFHIDSSHVTFFGLCPHCLADRQGSSSFS